MQHEAGKNLYVQCKFVLSLSEKESTL
jgi:hypothetical protein